MCSESFDLFKKEDFLAMGIALGDTYLLMQKFSKTKEVPSLDRAKRLKSLLQSSNRKGKDNFEGSKRSKPITLSTHFVWHHYCEKECRYKQVRENSGGGNRTRIIGKASTYQELLTYANDLFFPNGTSGNKKYISLMVCHLADFALNEIEESKFDTLEVHMIDNGLSKVKFALMTKDFSFSNDFSDDEEFVTPIFKSKKKKDDSSNHSIPFPVPFPVDSSTPTTALEEERKLKEEQDENYLVSLKADQNKDKVCFFKYIRKCVQ